MRSFLTTRASFPVKIHPALTSFADECCGTLARLVAYVGALALLAIAGAHLWEQLPLETVADDSAKARWSVAVRGYPAFALSQFDLPGKTEAYDIYRHPEGGRRDVLRWAAAGEKPLAELEIYRFGGEWRQAGPAISEIANRMDPDGTRELQAAGVIDSKFGAVTLLGLADDTGNARPCLGFLKRFAEPNLQISGWSCQGETLPARRAAVGCILDRLMLLTSGNDPKLAELFARAELRRGSCAPAASGQPVASMDWVTGTQNPRLRGSL